MAQLRVNPTRMELTRLKRRLKTAVRGHKLLKDKRDEMVRRFMLYVRRNKELREEVERLLAEALGSFVLARAVMSEGAVEEALMYPARRAEIEVSKRNIMSINVPVVTMAKDESSSQYPYGYVSTSGELDTAILALAEVLPKMIELAEAEKTCNMLADEIEKTRRRVNALEYVMIPDMKETIRYITMKLDENERGNLSRLMKMKSILEERA